MAIFTYIATAIVGAIGTVAGITLATSVAGVITLTTAGTIATSLIAGGLGYITAKVTGVFKTPNIQAQKDPGVKVQLSPSTDRRVPLFYGKIHTGGIIVDAEIKNRNNTMVYCMVIGEKTDAGAFTVQSIKRQDATLNFTGANVTSWTDPNGTTASKIANKMRCRVFAGNAQSSVNQIFPTTGKVAAQSLMSTITASTNYEDLVYAIFEIDYDAEEGLTALGTITYELTNSLSEPSNVLLDFCRSSRYGAGLSNAELDLNSFNDLYDYSTAQVAFTNVGGGAGTHDRWKIDGQLSTYQAVKDNIDQICQSCATFFTYDNKQGKFKVVPNREATTAEKNAAFVFNDDNIVTSIDITSTELYSLYNQTEAEYPSVAQEDQTKTIIISTPSGDKNTNEPDNMLGTRYNLVNDAPRVHNLANIDLRQSRLSTVVQFNADYSALTVDVGDIVKLTNTLYGFSEKLFRVMKVSEVESETGYISAKLTLLEYNDSIYSHDTVQSDGALGLSGIPAWWDIWGNVDYGDISNIIGNITIVDDPTSNTANIVNPPDGNVIANIDIGNIDIGIGGIGIGSGFGMLPSINFPITIPDIPDISEIVANVNPVSSTVANTIVNMPPTIIPIKPPKGNTTFTPGEEINVSLPIPDPALQDQSFSVGPLLPDFIANIDLSMINPFGQTTAISTAPNITLAPKGKIDRGLLGPVQAGLQVEEDGFNASMANSATSNVQLQTDAALVTANTIIDVGAIDEGIFSAVNNMVPYGATLADGNAAISYLPFRTIEYKAVDVAPDGKMTANTSISNIGEIVLGSGIQGTGITQLGTFDDNFKYEVSRARGNIVAVGGSAPPASNVLQYIPANVTVGNWANTNLTDSGSGRRVDVTNSDKRISKSDFYLDIGGFF